MLFLEFGEERQAHYWEVRTPVLYFRGSKKLRCGAEAVSTPGPMIALDHPSFVPGWEQTRCRLARAGLSGPPRPAGSKLKANPSQGGQRSGVLLPHTSTTSRRRRNTSIRLLLNRRAATLRSFERPQKRSAKGHRQQKGIVRESEQVRSRYARQDWTATGPESQLFWSAWGSSTWTASHSSKFHRLPIFSICSGALPLSRQHHRGIFDWDENPGRGSALIRVTQQRRPKLVSRPR